MTNPAQIVAHKKRSIRKLAFEQAVLQIIQNDPVEFQKRIARIMVECKFNPGSVVEESRLAVTDFVNSL